MVVEGTAEGCLESKNYAPNETPASNGHPVVEGEAAAGMTTGLKKGAAETNVVVNTTFDFKMPFEKKNAATNSTFDFKQPTGREIPPADSTFVKLPKENPAVNTTFDLKKVPEKENPAINTTFDLKKVPDKENPAVNTTFDFKKLPAEKANPQVNTTFECTRPATGETQVTNSTFNADDQPAGGEAQQAAANTTFDCNQKRNDVNTTFTSTQRQNAQLPSSSHNQTIELNVTFEKGEYRIGDQNETVNLMDVEENILQVILDATPKKGCHQVPTSTPKTSGHHQKPHLKAGVSFYLFLFIYFL